MEPQKVLGRHRMPHHLAENVEVQKKALSTRMKAPRTKMKILRKETRTLGKMRVLRKAIIPRKQIEKTQSLCIDHQ